MAEYPDDLIKEFKSKVEEAISLLPQIPEVNRHEVWTYWQIISVAVKAAVGGRGPVVAKQTTTKQTRPRGRPRLQGQGSSVAEWGGKNQVDKKGTGRDVRKVRRKGQEKKQKLSNKRNKSHRWSQGHWCDGLGGRKRAHCSDISSVAGSSSPAAIITVMENASSTTSGSVKHVLSVPIAAENPTMSITCDSNNTSTDRLSPSVLVVGNANIVHIDRNSNTTHGDWMSQSVPKAAVEGSDISGASGMLENDASLMLKTQTMKALELTCSKPHAQQESNSGEKQTVPLTKSADGIEDDVTRQECEDMEMSSDDIKQECEGMEISSNEITQQPHSLTVSLQGAFQSKSLPNEPVSEMLGTALNEADTCAKPAPNFAEESETEKKRGVIVAESGVLHDDIVSETVKQEEKLAKVHASGQMVDILSAETSPSLSTADILQSQKTETDGETVQLCHDLSVSLGCDDTSIISADALLNKPHLEKKSASLACGSLAGVKRKRGRPRKQTDQVDVSPAHIASCSLSSVPSHSDKSSQEFAICSDLVNKGIEASSSARKKEYSHKKQPKSKSKTLSSAEPSSAAVRRSERRAVPNRDKIFCYFSQRGKQEMEELEVKEEEVEEEEDMDSFSEDEDEERGADTMGAEEGEEEEEVKEKTEEEKRKQRTCPKCHVILMSASSLTAHMRIHTGERPFACPVCHKTFTTKGNCERHEVTHVGLKAFTCPQCNKKFTEKKSLKIHMRAHTGERPYQCKQCGMRFFQSGTLKTHMDRHTGHKGHLCELCGKAFRQSCQLRVHMRRHKLQMPFQCQHCSRTFYTKSDMERHELRHTGERPYSCDQCPKTFTRVQYLREHQNSHLGRRPYKCVICGSTFHTFAACHRHVNKHKVPEHPLLEQTPEQIHVEVTPDTPSHQVMEQVQVILDQQQLTDFQAPHIQTFIIPDQSATGNPSIIAGPNPQSSAHAILSNLGLEVEESSEMYHVTLVDPAQSITIPADQRVVSSISAADFSAINLLANATTQLSAPP